MYINNAPFPETLQQAQKDLYDINTLLLDPLKKMEKTAKRKKVMWKIMSGSEHAVGVTFGALSAIEIYHQNYFLGCMYSPFMAIGAIAGFKSGSVANTNAEYVKKTHETIENVQREVMASLPERLHEIAETIRNRKQK